jgi:hypothetical protein
MYILSKIRGVVFMKDNKTGKPFKSTQQPKKTPNRTPQVEKPKVPTAEVKSNGFNPVGSQNPPKSPASGASTKPQKPNSTDNKKKKDNTTIVLASVIVIIILMVISIIPVVMDLMDNDKEEMPSKTTTTTTVAETTTTAVTTTETTKPTETTTSSPPETTTVPVAADTELPPAETEVTTFAENQEVPTLDEIVANNPDVAYLLIKADTQDEMFAYNADEEYNTEDMYYFYQVDRVITETYSIETGHALRKSFNVDDNSTLWNVYEETGRTSFSLNEVLEYYVFENDSAAAEFLEYYYQVYSTYYPNLSAEKLAEDWYWVNQKLRDWKNPEIASSDEEEHEENEEKADFMIELLTNIDEKSIFYQATGNLAIHAGFIEDGNVLDSGIFMVNNQEYIFVIAGATQDEVLAIAKNLYNEVAT